MLVVKEKIILSAIDFFFLQSRGYPRDPSLNLVGNRYRLTKEERNILKRGVFSQAEATKRLGKKFKGDISNLELLVVDGHNVQITLESLIINRPIIKGNDGALRDIGEISKNFKPTEVSLYAIDMFFNFLSSCKPKKLIVYFDAPMSRSGELASIYRKRIGSLKIDGNALAVPVPESQFPYDEAVVASSDSEVIDKSKAWIDLPQLISSKMNILKPFMDFSFLKKFYQPVDLSWI